MPGIASKRAVSSSAIARRSSAGVEPGDDRERDLRPDAVDGEQLHEELALVGVGEAVELQRVLADVQVRLDRHLAAAVARRERARRRVRRGSRRRSTSSTSPSPASRRPAGPRSRAITAATLAERRRERVADRDRERVGRVVGVGSVVERRGSSSPSLHLRLVGAAVAADRLLDARRRVLGAVERRRARHATSTAPRACPTESAMRASAPTNDSSSATASGACSAMSSRTPVEDRLQPQLRRARAAGVCPPARARPP